MTGILSLVSERQGAISADMRRFYGVSLNEALTSWTARDFTEAVKHLPRESALARDVAGDLHEWDYVAANLAELVDLMHFWLHNEYSQWIYDEDDPENKNAPKRKPPKEPLIPPVAFRPPSVRDELLARYIEQAQAHGVDTEPRRVSSDEFDAVIDAM